MYVGDKVKAVHGLEKGVVKKVVSVTEVEVETEDGFLYTVLKKDWVVVNQKEAKYFGNQENKTSQSKSVISVFSEQGLFLCWVKDTKGWLLSYVNNTDNDLLFTFYEKAKDDSWLHSSHGSVSAKEYVVLKLYDEAQFNATKVVNIQYLKLKQGSKDLPILESKEIHVNKLMFKEEPVRLPLLDRLGYLMQVDLDTKKAVDEIKTGLGKTMEKGLATTLKVQPPPKEVDLHIEKLSPFHERLSSGDIFKLQLKEFESCLDRAIASGMDEIVFIHGIGNGSLKIAIHKSLSKHPNVAHFQDAQREKFGYGATKVKLK